MLMKITFVIGATFCLMQIVCTFPGGSRRKRNDTTEGQYQSRKEKIMADVLAIATNFHANPLNLPKSLESDRRNHIVASALTELWMDLRTMESVQDIYVALPEQFNASKNVDAVSLLLEPMDKAMAADPRIGQPYKELKSKYEKLVVLESDHLEKEKLLSLYDRVTLFEKNNQFKELLSNSAFAEGLNENLNKTNDKMLNTLALTKAMVEMSQSAGKYEKLQQIYRQSLAEVGTNIEWIFSGLPRESMPL